jgi:hypothetical protein
MKNTNMPNFGPLLKTPFLNKIAKYFYGPSITHKDELFAKNCIQIG